MQPEHAIDDRDLTDSIWADQTALPYPLRALADTGANLLFGSDAPVSPLDPWAAMAAAVFRTRDGREPWQPEQGVDAATALAASTHGGSTAGAVIEPGARADLALMRARPAGRVGGGAAGDARRATLLAGRLTHLRLTTAVRGIAPARSGWGSDAVGRVRLAQAGSMTVNTMNSRPDDRHDHRRADRAPRWAAYGDRGSARPERAVPAPGVFVLAMTSLSVLIALFWTGVGLIILVDRPADRRRSRCSSRAASASPTATCSGSPACPRSPSPSGTATSPASTGFWTTLTRPLRNAPLLGVPRCTA